MIKRLNEIIKELTVLYLEKCNNCKTYNISFDNDCCNTLNDFWMSHNSATIIKKKIDLIYRDIDYIQIINNLNMEINTLQEKYDQLFIDYENKKINKEWIEIYSGIITNQKISISEKDRQINILENRLLVLEEKLTTGISSWIKEKFYYTERLTELESLLNKN